MSTVDTGTAFVSAPATAGAGSARTRKVKETIRYTLDLVKPQHRFLKVFALDNNVEASKVVRALLEEMEEDTDLQARVSARINGETGGDSDSSE